MNESKKPLRHHLHDYFFPHERNNYRPHLFSLTSIAVLAIAVIIFETGYLVQTRVVFLTTDFLASVLPSVLTDLTNVARAEQGLPLVTPNPVLAAAAQQAAEDMAARGYFAHVSPDGKTPWYWLDQVGYKYRYAGQNLAVNFTDSENVQSAWLASPTHRANIVKPQYTEIGFGIANGVYEGRSTTFVVEYFASPAVVAAPAPVETTEVTPAEVALEPATPVDVLGTEDVTPAAPVAAEPVVEPAPVVAPAPIIPESDRVTEILASPLTALEVFLTLLLSVVTLAYAVAMFLRGKLQHPSVVVGGAFLMLFISGALLLGVTTAGPIGLPSDVQMASVEMALP